MSLGARRPRVYLILVGCLFAVSAMGFTAYWLREPRRAPRVEPFFAGLGDYQRKVTTNSPLAQKYFDQGLAFLYGFNDTEAARSFEAAANADPQCAMAFWGIAIADGESISDPASDEPLAKDAVAALATARELEPGATPVERDLIEALSHRYADPPPADPRPLDRAYAAAMRKVCANHADDGDVGALCGQAVMMLHRKGWWTQEGEPEPGTEEVIRTLRDVLAKHPRHPYALHLMVHVVEASPHPEMGDAAADLLRNFAPGLGHLTHMPSHIDIRRGRWQQAVVASEKAVAADRAYREIVSDPGVYCRILMAHDNHMLAYAAAMQGESHKATEAIGALLVDLPADFVTAHTGQLDALFAMPYELHLRFGRWDAMLAEPPPKAGFPVATAFWHFARATAFAAKRQIASAKSEQADFVSARKSIPEGAVFCKNPADNVLAVGENMLAGEILYREGKVDEAIQQLREAAFREDHLQYTEPPEWILTSRHVLGATLLDAGRYAQAQAVYAEDLQHHPENGWSLFGLSRAYRMQKKTAEAADAAARLQKAWQHADIKLTASCLCLPSKN